MLLASLDKHRSAGENSLSFIVYRLLFIVYCLLFIVYCLLFIDDIDDASDVADVDAVVLVDVGSLLDEGC